MWRVTTLLAAILLMSCAPRVWRLSQDGLLIPPGRGGAARNEHSRIYGPYDRDAQVDLLPGMRVKVVAPILPDGLPASTDATIPDAPGTILVRSNISGHETSYFAVSPWRFESGEVVAGGERRPLTMPEASRIEVPVQLPRVRLLFQRRVSRDDRPIALLAAASIEDLDREGARTPITVGKGVAVSPEIPIVVNGARVWVALGSRVGSVARGGGLIEKLALRRMYRGKPVAVRFDRRSRRVLEMLLNGGDELTWSQ